MDVNGTVAEGFEAVRDAFVRNFEVLGDRGAAVAVYRDGRKVVDLWAGPGDVDGGDGDGADGGGEAWAAGTAQVVRSATKGVAAVVPLLLHQRGLLDLDAPVAAYWPEFKAGGKERALVRDLLAHRAGVPALDVPLTPAEAEDGLSGARAVAEQQAFWEPGSAHGYHAQTYSWLLSELVLRVTGASLGQWLAQEVTGPRGLEFWIGLPEAERARVGRVGPVDPPQTAGGLRTRPPEKRFGGVRRPVVPDAAGVRGHHAAARRERPGVPGGRTPGVGGHRHGTWPGRPVRGPAGRHRGRHAAVHPADGPAGGYGACPGRTGCWWSTRASARATCCTARPRR